MTHYEKCFNLVIGSEGGLTLDPKDRGNWTDGQYGTRGGVLHGTKYGVSAMSYPRTDIKDLTLSDAQAIFKADFWDELGADELPDALAYAAFDTAVNAGLSRARGYL